MLNRMHKHRLFSIHKWPFLPGSAFSAGFRLRRTGSTPHRKPLCNLDLDKNCSFMNRKHTVSILKLWMDTRLIFLLFSGIILIGFPDVAATLESPENNFMNIIKMMSSVDDRSTGTPGSQKAAKFIKDQFEQLGFDTVGSFPFSVPVRKHGSSRLFLPKQKRDIPIQPILGNAIDPETIDPQGLVGPLIYVGSGELDQFNGKAIAGAILLMEIDSGKNWLNAANFGAKALIYIDRGPTTKDFFHEKSELTPIRFPRFWIPYYTAKEIFGTFETVPDGLMASKARLISDIVWKEVAAENIYGLIPGTDEKLRDELIVVDAFYDSTALVYGRSPGADEACSIATLLELAIALKKSPPKRSFLLVATSGHAQTLAGLRELIWSINTRSKNLKHKKKSLEATIIKNKKILNILTKAKSEGSNRSESPTLLKDVLIEQIKTEVDKISRQLMHLRLYQKDDSNQEVIQKMAEQRLFLRRLSWRTNFEDLSSEELVAIQRLIPLALKENKVVLTDATRYLKQLKRAKEFRSIVKEMDLITVISLHLSSHGSGFGAFNRGGLYPLKPNINRVAIYSFIDEVLRNGAAEVAGAQKVKSLFRDTLRPSRQHTWESYFVDRPYLGGEVSALAGLLGVSLVTIDDGRSLWGTPYDLPETINAVYAQKQSTFVTGLIQYMADVPVLHRGDFPRNGFATVSGRAKFLRHGELFPDQSAPGSIILAYQGPGVYYTMVDSMGNFALKGVADKKHVLEKVIIEGYRFFPDTGSVSWAIDKKQTGKAAYRLKIRRRFMETELVMFACKQSTVFNLLEPRNFRYMTKIQLIDGRREATPLRYWWSRIDTRSSIIASFFLESGTHLKLTLSDTVLRKKMILTNATENRPEGTGYLIDDWPTLHYTDFKVARDMWTLLEPRIKNLENHGIFNEKIRTLQQEGTLALQQAGMALQTKSYDLFSKAAAKSWALASRVYDQVEKTQKDVLFGVLFYIALFVPFAFCMERLVFSYANIHKRIIAFSVILLLLITLIYNVHPAFQLAYSPTVVILAFFIIGLSLIVTIIIFFRFEEEMILLQRRAKHMKPENISRWKAFAAAFFLGVSNLRRRRLRTILTCTTLIILTFTIMSFTSVKSLRRHTRILYQQTTPYNGFLLKNVNWQDLPAEALSFLSNAFDKKDLIAPRVWLETGNKTRATRVPVRYQDQIYEAKGLIGLSVNEINVTGIDQIIVKGRWFRKGERHVVLLPERMAKNLGIDPDRSQKAFANLWGTPFEVVGTFSGAGLQEQLDLDGEPLTPAIFPGEASMEVTEVEMEAMESGEDIKAFQSRYNHVPGELTAIVPFPTLLASGGHLKSVAVLPVSMTTIQAAAYALVDRFGLSLFSGEPGGTFLYNASDTISYSGVPNILIPLIISIFIVLNTMIGSVYERKREIGIYTSVGLAPYHVSFLFIAEAMAFAVMSVVLGYLLAQTTASIFGGSSYWSGITVNYSSLAGIGAMLLVIFVVLISVIYPSRVAAQIAVPDVNRSWTLPESKGNMLELTLPFLMKYNEHQSIGGCLFSYFEGHMEVSHGIFSTGDIDFFFACPTCYTATGDDDNESCCSLSCLNLNMEIWLAPFDFGIRQYVKILFCPSEEDARFLEIKVSIKRIAGEANAWRRINRAFLNDVRKQLLVWRSLDESAQQHYEQLIVSLTTEKGLSLLEK